ncbi:MAG: SPOR domain-containing protein [Bacteroidota bacterium]|nr:SPOR domain-containing protein [Bacteroidota bacterium]
MRHRILSMVILSAWVLCFVGCSPSEETVSGEAVRAPEEFKKTDDTQTVVPSTDQPTDSVATQQGKVPARESESRDLPPPVRSDLPKKGAVMWSVQIGAFRAESGADQLFTDARTKFSVPVYKDYDSVSGLFKITVGSFQTREQAARFKEEVIQRGYPDAFIVEVYR